MLKLADAMHRWSPGEGAGATDPRTVLEASWSEIVGPQVARHSHPARITANTLMVTTRSSSWSHQLSLLADSILHAMAARIPDCGIERLRFRVGSLPRRASGGDPPAPRRMSRRSVAGRAKAASASQALDRFRREVEQLQGARRSQGWHSCAACGLLIAPEEGTRCTTCVVADDDRRMRTVAQLLFDAPWLGFRGTAELASGLQEEEYERIRAQLLTRWWAVLMAARDKGRLSADGRERLIASSYVLLRSNVSPEEIIPATVRGILGDELHDLIYGK
ncbi:MAG: DUF721 domain-containing protein [Candidatus Eremiobacteraeota bacterium]|nr:DUF721 domain-containing protein [Candidatus Eremiobacteraeota bacterium]MBV9055726.1 DUF721 domain-containing protein [Candidatus Eremiobacteraeota bacterium]